MQKFLRIVRLDQSDADVYEQPAEAGEWAVVGSFYFWDSNPEQLVGKTRQAFVHGFLGLDSFGWGTLVAVAEINPVELELLTQRLAQHLVERFGAPDVATALPAAREEIAFVSELCEHEINTLLALQRDVVGDEIRESFKVFRQPDGAAHEYVRLWQADDESHG